MNRRNFIKNTGIVAPLIVSFSSLSIGQKSFLQNLALKQSNPNRVLVLIQLNGGNDSLNTIIPINRYNILSEARKNILIPEKKILKLYDTNSFGFHPSLTGLQKLYNDKMVSIIHGVGYPNPDRSHFKGINIKLTANCTTEASKSGWVGRYLEQEYPQYSTLNNATGTNGPPCVRVGEVSPIISQGTDLDFGIGINDISDLNNTGQDIFKDPVSNDMGGSTVALIRAISRQVEMFAPIIKAAAGRQKTLSKLYPGEGKNILADQLKLVAGLIGGDLKSRVYVVNQNGYDTHANQVDKSDTTKGHHAELLKDLSDAIAAFEDDLQLMGKQEDVLGMTFSEFGRRIKSSDSYGTDHGTAESVIFFGTKLKGGMTGTAQEMPLEVIANDEKNLPFQFDFRALYASVLTDWFDVKDDALKAIIQQGAGDRLNLFSL